MRRTLGVAFTAMVLVVVLGLSAASAGTFRTTAKWKNCDTMQAGISVRATFADVTRRHGTGRFLVKKSIRWDVYKGNGQWRVRDNAKSRTGWLRITNPQYDFVTTMGDKTSWGNIYSSNWRAHVTFILIKDRRGPIDKKVDKVDIFPQKGSFQEAGDCRRRPPSRT